ncbi:MAG: hypothetical protein A2043_08120 [Candidatus Schekmanbacteria bacterium GWA2_38_9]|nr:MAG: hypothetical protein A2043_08120 [Candidatus Schekmanbacteria bacterium GWA2_38_9]
MPKKQKAGPKILARVKSKKGFCTAGHEIGDEFILSLTTPEGLCVDACICLVQNIHNLIRTKDKFWEDADAVVCVDCPDKVNLVTFKLKKINFKL